jgi:hypothetical protein
MNRSATRSAVKIADEFMVVGADGESAGGFVDNLW